MNSKSILKCSVTRVLRTWLSNARPRSAALASRSSRRSRPSSPGITNKRQNILNNGKPSERILYKFYKRLNNQVLFYIYMIRLTRYEGGRYIYKIHRSPMCDYMINFILKLKQLPEKYMMNSVLENFTILQVKIKKTDKRTVFFFQIISMIFIILYLLVYRYNICYSLIV